MPFTRQTSLLAITHHRNDCKHELRCLRRNPTTLVRCYIRNCLWVVHPKRFSMSSSSLRLSYGNPCSQDVVEYFGRAVHSTSVPQTLCLNSLSCHSTMRGNPGPQNCDAFLWVHTLSHRAKASSHQLLPHLVSHLVFHSFSPHILALPRVLSRISLSCASHSYRNNMCFVTWLWSIGSRTCGCDTTSVMAPRALRGFTSGCLV